MGGNIEEPKSSKTEKPSTPAAPDMTNVHVYPDWAAMQAYYGPRMALPPFYNTAMSSGPTPHPYMWGPAQTYSSTQPMMSPYGTPYTAVYPPGGIYGHPGVPLGAHPHGHGIPTSPPSSAPGSMEASSAKLPGNTDRGLMKKLKSFDGLAMSIGNGAADGAEEKSSQSSESEGSSEGTTSGGDQGRRKRSREGTPSVDMKTEIKPADMENAGSNKATSTAVAHSSGTGKSVGAVSPTMTTALELRSPSSGNLKTMPGETWFQNDKELKRERRKQSNRESARRSRLRKQAETEELAKKVEALLAENVALKSEISRLTENSEKMRLENATLVEKLENVQPAKNSERIPSKFDGNSPLLINTENLLSRVNNSSGSIDRANEGEEETYRRKSSAGAKLHQLLDSKPRKDAVVAG